MSLAGSHVTSGKGLTFLPRLTFNQSQRPKAPCPFTLDGFPTAARVNPLSTDPIIYHTPGNPSTPFALFPAFLVKFVSALTLPDIESQSH